MMGWQRGTSNPAVKSVRKRSRRLLFVAVLCFSLLAIQEILFRFLFPIPETVRFNRIRYQLLAESDPRFRPLIKRGLVYDRLVLESQPDQWRYPHKLNRFGFRDRDFSVSPPNGKRRIVMVGDSITEGQGAPSYQSIPAVLQQKLGDSTEVLNLGVIAATMDNVAHLACDSVVVLNPQCLILVLYANDLPSNYSGTISPTSLEILKQKVSQDVNLAGSQYWWPHILRLGMRILEDQPIYCPLASSAIRYFAPVPDPTNPFSSQPEPILRLKPELELAMRHGEINPWLVQQADAIPGMISHDFRLGGSAEPALRTIQEVCRQNKVELVVVYVPFSGTVHERYRQPLIDSGMPHQVAESLTKNPEYLNQSRHLKEICERLNLKLIDTTQSLKTRENQGKPQYWSYDTHPRPEGYETIAETIAAEL